MASCCTIAAFCDRASSTYPSHSACGGSGSRWREARWPRTFEMSCVGSVWRFEIVTRRSMFMAELQP